MARRSTGRSAEIFGFVASVRTVRRAGDATRIVIAVVTSTLLLVAARVGEAIRSDRLASGDQPWSLPTFPSSVDWVIEVARFAGTFGVLVIVVLSAAVGRRARMLLDAGISVVLSLVVVYLVQTAMGEVHGHLRLGDEDLLVVPPVSALAVATAAACSGAPFLGRVSRRLLYALLALGAIGTALHEGTAIVGVLAGLTVGWGVVAVVHLAFGSPTGFPGAERAVDDAAELGIEIIDVEPVDDQDWSVARFTAQPVQADGIDGRLAVVVYGRDAADAQLLSRLWRFLWYRDAGRASGYSRVQLVEHEAFATMLAERAGVSVPHVLGAGFVESTEDAVLLQTRPDGVPLASLAGDRLTDGVLARAWGEVRHLHEAGIAHGTLDGEHVLVADDGRAAIIDLRKAVASASDEQLARDVAELLVATTLAVGCERAVAAARDALGADTLAASLPFLQPAVLGTASRQALHHQRKLLGELRAAAATASGVEEPPLVELRRIKPSTVLIAAGSLFGFWLIIGEIASAGDLWSTLASADLAWIFVVLLLSFLPAVGTAYAMTGSVTVPLPFGSVVILEYGLAFMGLIGSTVASVATIVRFFQRRGLAASIAVSSGVLVGFSNFVVQAIVVAACLPFVSGQFSPSSVRGSGSGSGSDLLWIILIALVVIGVVVGALLFRPRFRHMVSDKVKPQATAMWDNLRQLFREPRRVLRLLLGNAAAQVFYALALGAALAAFGQSVSFAALLVVNTAAALLGGAAPVPGGMGVTEAALVAGLSSFGVPQTEGVAAVLTYRLFTAYLAPVWGYPSLYWLRRKEYL